MAVNIELGRSASHWLALLAVESKEQAMAEAQRSTAEALKQRRKCEKAPALDIEKFTAEVASIFKSDLKRVRKTYDIDNSRAFTSDF